MTESNTYKISEVIAQLDVFERELMGMVSKVREFRHALFETIDTDVE